MARFAVTITETLCKTLIVEAPDYFEAYDKIERAYNAGDIVLEADDFFDSDISWTSYSEWDHMFCDEWKEEQYGNYLCLLSI